MRTKQQQKEHRPVLLFLKCFGGREKIMAKKIHIRIPRLRRTTIAMPEPGARPGTLEVRDDLPPPVVTRVSYDADASESETVAIDDLERLIESSSRRVVWLDIHGVGNADDLRRIGSALKLNPLTLEDIAHVHQHPKLEEIDDYLFVVARSVRVAGDGHVDNEQLSFVLKDNLLVSFQERPGDALDPVRRRISNGKGPIRRNGAGYLLYALLDVIIDSYFPVIELYGESMDKLEDQIREEPSPGLAQAVHLLRRELRLLRRVVWPLRDVAAALSRNELALIDDALVAPFRDCYDHLVQLADQVEASRERVSDVGNLYQTMVGERTNQVMKTLTIVATIFIPLTFLCGLYGMNFDPEVSPYNMPELKWRYGYLVLWGVMVTTVLGMLWFFRRRGWIRASRDVDPSPP